MYILYPAFCNNQSTEVQYRSTEVDNRCHTCQSLVTLRLLFIINNNHCLYVLLKCINVVVNHNLYSKNFRIRSI